MLTVTQGTTTPYTTAHMALGAASLLPVKTDAVQYKDRLVEIRAYQNKFPGLLRRLDFSTNVPLATAMMCLLACAELFSKLLVRGPSTTPPDTDSHSALLTQMYNGLYSCYAKMLDLEGGERLVNINAVEVSQ
jgi:hypothetical protein